MSAENICGNCAWFDPYTSPKFDEKQQSIIESVQPDSQQVIYGKCIAKFNDADGQPARYDFGTFDIAPCTATDDAGNNLFALGVYPRNFERE